MSSHRGRRVWGIVGAVILAIALVAGTWAAASRFQSPAQRDAAASAPPPQPVVVAVERGDLVERTTVMSQAVAEGATDIPLPLSSGVSVVTRQGVDAGGQLASGGVAAWVNDRPVIALRGSFPLFRDVGPGDTGDDVRLVQQALADLGYGIAVDGDFGSFTAECVKDLYRGLGAEAPTREVTEVASGEATGSAGPDAGSDAGESPSSSEKEAATQTPDAAAQGSSTPKTEVYVRASEVLVLGNLPARVVSVPGVGTTLTADNATLRVAGSGVSLTASVPGTVAARLTESTTGSAEVDGTALDVRVGSVKAASQDGGQAGAADSGQAAPTTDSTVEFVPTTGTVPAEWAGREDVLITVDLSEPVLDTLLVPQRAIATDASGAAAVLVEQADGSFAQVAVTQRSCVGGMCAVEDADGLDEGANVRVDR